MKLNRVYFPFHSDEEIELMQKIAYRNPNVPNVCVVPTQECDVIAPVDEVTGNRTNVLTKIVDPNLSSLERDRLIGSLQRIPASKRTSLSDDELICMLPSRYNSTLTDNEKYADYISEMIDNEFNTSTDEPSNDPPGGSTDEPTPNV